MIIELIGPAGAGKSTLSKALSEHIDRVKLEPSPFFRKVEDFPFFVRNIFLMFPTLSRICLLTNGKYPSWGEFVSLVILNGWHQVLYQKALKDEAIFILDHGPVYMLMFLTLFGPERIKPNNVKEWWDHTFRHWAETLDLVIWLDTSLPVLVQRIRAREIWHSVKDREDNDAYQHLESYRLAFESVISRLLACSPRLKVLRFDTGKNSLEETVEKVINELHLEPSQGNPR